MRSWIAWSGINSVDHWASSRLLVSATNLAIVTLRGVWGRKRSGRMAVILSTGFVVGVIALAWLLVGLVLVFL